MRERVLKAGKRVRESLCSYCYESHKKTKIHNSNIYAEGLGQSHAGFLVVGSVSVRSYENRLVDSVDILVVSLTPLASTILPPPLQQDSPRSA